MVYVPAIVAKQAPGGNMPLGRDPLIFSFLRGTLRLRSATRIRVPAWDLAIILAGLSAAPFEPFESVSEKFLTFRDLQALSVFPARLEFALRMVKAFLYPKQGYIPKVPTNTVGPIV